MPKLDEATRKKLLAKGLLKSAPSKPIAKPAKPDPTFTKPKDLPNETRLGTNINGIWTYLSVPGMVLGANYSEYTHERTKACIDLTKCTELYKAASKPDKERMQAFVLANSPPAKYIRYWYLINIRNLDTGKKMLCAGYKLEGPGLTLDQIKKAVGL